MKQDKILIAGTGRAGTTLLMQIFTELGLDTGFSKADFATDINSVSHGGLEFNKSNVDLENLPRVLKSPYFFSFIDSILSNEKINIEHVFIPIRKLEDAARSRIRIQEIFEKESGQKSGGDIWPGALAGTDSKEDQEVVLGRQLTSLIMSLDNFSQPYSFLNFPKFAQSADYLFEKIRFLIPYTSFEFFYEIFYGLVDESKIHSFEL